MNRSSTFLWLLLLMAFHSPAQNAWRCPSDQPLASFLATQPEATQIVEAREANINRWIQNFKSQASTRSDQIYTIPVVVHIVWFEEEDNIPDAQVLAQIEILNEDYNFKNNNTFFIPSEFEDAAASIGFEFCLARVAPDGSPATGITRTQTDFDNIGNFCDVLDPLNRKRIFYTDLGGKDAWDPERYLNIWVAPMGGLLGRATPPEPFTTDDPCNQMEPGEDGVIIDPKYFGPSCYPPHHLGRTTTHEIGHYFNLIHTFGLDTDDCDTDRVSDTPEQLSPYSGCPLYPQSSCGSRDMFMNFMDLVDDECMALFTEGQKMRMLAALLGPRNGLIDQQACTVPPLPTDYRLATFPNPATECFYVRFDSPVEDQIVVLRVYDAAGKLVYAGQHNAPTIPAIITGDWGPGLFLVELSTETERFVSKVMVL